MLRISGWGTYIPKKTIIVEGLEVPAPSDDEDSVTMAYETSLRLLGDLENSIKNLAVVSDDMDHVKLGVLLSLLDVSDVSAYISQDLTEALTFINKVPRSETSMLIVVNSRPPAGCAALTFNDVATQAKVLFLKTLSENLTFTKPSSTKLNTFMDLIHEVLLLRKAPKLLSNVLKELSLEPSEISYLAGWAPKLSYLIKAVSRLGLPSSALSILSKLSAAGFSNKLLAMTALIESLKSSNTNDKMLFAVLEESGKFLSSVIERV
ncbi:MAG: hypothetical protein J7J20_00845 [Desulfurococcales archaeon]|nr:hypothetical protein [Desulfurococcales archaeon]